MKSCTNCLKIGRWSFWIIVLLLAWLHPFWAWQGFPLSEVDTLWFLPPAICYKLHHLFLNSLHPQAFGYDLTGHHIFAFYPTGFPWLMSQLLVEPTGRGAITSLAILNSLILLLSAFFLDYYIIQKLESKRIHHYLIGILGMFCLGTYTSSYGLGRPDFLATFLILIIFWITFFSNFPLRVQLILNGLLLGSLAFIHPISAFMTSSLLGIFFSYRHSFKTVLCIMTAICTLGVAILLGWFSINPVPIEILILGIKKHSCSTLVNGTTSSFVKYFIIHSYATGFGFLFFATVLYLMFLFRKKFTNIISPIGVLFFGLLYAFLAYWFVGKALDRAYNLWVFTPFYIGILVHALFSENIKKSICYVLLGILLIGSFGFLHKVLLFPFYIKYGQNYAHFRQEISPWLNDHPGTVAVSKSLWVATEDYERTKSFGIESSDLADFGLHPDYIFLQQRYTELESAPEIEGYQIIQNHFCNKKPRLFGIKLSDSMPGFFYAIYQHKKMSFAR
jgi:hypothetical protein